jgi:hypothetical protein
VPDECWVKLGGISLAKDLERPDLPEGLDLLEDLVFVFIGTIGCPSLEDRLLLFLDCEPLYVSDIP